MSIRRLALVAAAAAQVAGWRPSGAAALDPLAFAAELERWSRAIAAADSGGPSLLGLRDSLPQAWTIPNGRDSVVVTTRWLGEALDALARDPGQATELKRHVRSRLDALAREARTSIKSPGSAPGVPEARGKLDAILRRPEFRAARAPSWLDGLRQSVSAAIFDLLQKIFGVLPRDSRLGSFLVWSLIALSFVLIAVWLVRTFGRAKDETGPEPATAATRAPGSSDWVERARAAAARGHHREAVRCAYWAGVQWLEERGSWTPDRARTPREYLRLLPLDHQDRMAFSALTQRFERTWYAFEPAGSEESRDAITLLTRIGCPFSPSPATASS